MFHFGRGNGLKSHNRLMGGYFTRDSTGLE